MKKAVSIVVGLVALGSANVCMTLAQPLEATPLPSELRLKVQCAEANAQIMAFGTETMRSQLTPEEFSRWPLALRDALPYWLEYQPFEFWSPELEEFAVGKFRALADDAKVETFAPAAANKAAIRRWLQEKAPFEKAQLKFGLTVRFGLTVNNQEGVTQLEANRGIDLNGFNTRELIAFGRLITSLSPKQKTELFADNMHLPIARFSQEQKQIFDELYGGGEQLGGVPINEFPNSIIVIDFQFRAEVQRVIAGNKEGFDVQTARPFDNFAWLKLKQ